MSIRSALKARRTSRLFGSWEFAGVLLLAAVSTMIPGQAAAKPSSRIAADLQVQAARAASDARLPVILQLAPGADRGRLTATLARQGVAVRRSFRSVDALLVDLAPRTLAQVAGLQGVMALSPDRTVRRMATAAAGHVALTTGAALSLPAGHGGAGVTIAMVDSGIDSDFPDFSDSQIPGAHRVLARVDLVADGARAADLYGHGTHVAGLAAGTGWSAPAPVFPRPAWLPWPAWWMSVSWMARVWERSAG